MKEGRYEDFGWVGLFLLATALTGCQSGEIYRITSRRGWMGRVLAADTGRPLADVRVRREVPMPAAGEDTPPKGKPSC